jgi:hypothetical protein
VMLLPAGASTGSGSGRGSGEAIAMPVGIGDAITSVGRGDAITSVGRGEDSGIGKGDGDCAIASTRAWAQNNALAGVCMRVPSLMRVCGVQGMHAYAHSPAAKATRRRHTTLFILNSLCRRGRGQRYGVRAGQVRSCIHSPASGNAVNTSCRQTNLDIATVINH